MKKIIKIRLFILAKRILTDKIIQGILKHPMNTNRHNIADNYTFKTHYQRPFSFKIALKNTLKTSIKTALKITNFKSKSKTIALIRTDNIGDYILFRNLLPCIKESQKYKNAKIILIGNSIWKELAEHFDKDFIDHFFWINIARYKQNKIYRLKILWQLNQLSITELINPIHSRTLQINEIVEFNGAKIKITCAGDIINLGSLTKIKTDALFNEIIPSLPNSEFEFFRNKAFMAQLIGQSIELNKTYFASIEKEKKATQILIFPSAQALERRWDTAHFAHLIKLISNQFSELEFLILGSKSDYLLGEEIRNNTPNSLKIKNLCGETSLVDLVKIIANSRLLISNETCAVHIGAAVDIPTVCVSNGNHFGRFNPYPSSMNCAIHYFYPDKSFNEIDNWYNLTHKYQYKSELNINKIKPEMILPTIISILKK
ncbi:MAG: glycosyltransferase family 9 protein [Saprospiraceae bacterium]|nr:glycosyltransferase family 9 protein [Saprospiraceae bacterium]